MCSQTLLQSSFLYIQSVAKKHCLRFVWNLKMFHMCLKKSLCSTQRVILWPQGLSPGIAPMRYNPLYWCHNLMLWLFSLLINMSYIPISWGETTKVLINIWSRFLKISWVITGLCSLYWTTLHVCMYNNKLNLPQHLFFVILYYNFYIYF